MDDTGNVKQCQNTRLPFYTKRNVNFWSRCKLLFLLLRNSRQNGLQIDRHKDDVFRVTTS